MRSGEKLLFMAGVGWEMYGKWRSQQLVSIVALAAMLAVVVSVLLGALAIGGIYLIYLFLLNQGVGSSAAVLLVALLILTLIGGLLLALRHCVHKLKTEHGPVKQVVEAFLDGLHAR